MKKILLIIALFLSINAIAQEMEVDGQLEVNHLWVNSGSDYPNIRLGKSFNDQIYVDNNSTLNSTFGGGGMFFRVQKGAFYDNPNEDWNDDYIDAMMITDEGNVIIGVRHPDSKLVVNGTIKASEVIITAQPTADFVFADDYTLRPLDEVQAFIEANKHLPEVPSAKDMEENGMGMAKMNQLLLQKVEELTLYMIEQQKQIDAMKTTIDGFQN